MIRIDARGMRCPWPAIRLARALREHRGGVVEILADDPAAPRELAQLAQSVGMRFAALGDCADPTFRIEP